MSPLETTSGSRRYDSLREIEAEIVQTGETLSVSFRRLLEALPGPPRRPNDLSRTLGIHQVLASKLLRAMRKRDPLATTHVMPGPEALRKLLDAAAAFPLDKSILDGAALAIERFEFLLDHVVDGRSELDAILGQRIPETRQRIEAANRQAAFKAMSLLKGAASDLTVSMGVVHPSDKPGRMDVVDGICQIGARRIRPGAPVQVGITLSKIPPDRALQTLQGQPAESNEQQIFLQEFSSKAPMRIERGPTAESTFFVVDDDRVGLRSSVDLCFALAIHNAPSNISPRKLAIGAHISLPTKLLIVDVYVHKSLFVGVRPEVIAFDTVPRGWVNANDVTPDIRWDVLEPVQTLDDGGAAIAEFPRYSDLFRSVCAQRGWDSRDFVGYRCRVTYPLYGSDYMMAFTGANDA